MLKLPCHSDERMGVRRALTLAAVALRALLRGAAPLGAAAAGAAGAGLAGWRHLWPWRCTDTHTHRDRSCCHSLGSREAEHPTVCFYATRPAGSVHHEPSLRTSSKYPDWLVNDFSDWFSLLSDLVTLTFTSLCVVPQRVFQVFIALEVVSLLDF